MKEFVYFLPFLIVQQLLIYSNAYQSIVDKNMGQTSNCISDQQNKWTSIDNNVYINTCNVQCVIQGTSTPSAVLAQLSINSGIRFTIPTHLLSNPYSIVGVDFIFAQLTNQSIRININDQNTQTIATPSFTIYEEAALLDCKGGNVYQFQKASLTFQGTINTPTLFVALDQNTNPFCIKQIRIWTNCCQNCQTCADSSKCIVCMRGFNKYTFPTGESVCEQYNNCSISNCFICAKYQAQEVCILCAINYKLNALGQCQLINPSSSCPDLNHYIDTSLACQTINSDCYYEQPSTLTLINCAAKEYYRGYKCYDNFELIINHYENYSNYYCGCFVQNCNVCTGFTGCNTCSTGYVYNSSTQTCKSPCLTNQYYQAGSCISCGTNCATCDSTSCLTCINNSYYISAASPHNCSLCMPSKCLTCTADGLCSVCNSGYSLSGDRSSCDCQVQNCLACNSSDGTLCDTCANSYLQSADHTSCSCQVNNCSQCQSNDGQKCQICLTGYTLDPTSFTCNCSVQNCLTCNALDGTLCDVCLNQYLQSSNHKQCSCQVNNCNTCLSNDGSKCQTCQSGYNLDPISFTCSCAVQNCLTCNALDGTLCDVCVNQYLQSTDHKQCTCQVNNCNTCLSNNGLLCQTCQSGYNLDPITKQCSCAVQNCLTCNALDGTLCDVCVNQYQQSTNHKQCTCQVNNCNSCQPNNGSLCQTCQTGYSLDSVTKQCNCAVQNCLTCNALDGTLCDVCVNQYLQSTDHKQCTCQVNNCNTCQPNYGLLCQSCQTGYNLDAITKQCSCAVQNCQSCNTSDGTLCDVCVNQYLQSVDHKSCTCQVNNCNICQPNNGLLCQTCQIGYNLDPISFTCSCAVQNCLTCNALDGTLCDVCVNQYLQSTNHKSCTCQVNNCNTCQPNNGLLCQSCQTGYNLDAITKQCSCAVQNCQVCSTADGSICDTCEQQYLKSVDAKSCSCQVANCITCDVLNGNKCQTCQTGYTLNATTFQCQCQDANCLTCDALNGSICQACSQNYTLNSATKQCVNGVCQVVNCQSCDINNINICRVCNVEYYLNQASDQCLQCAVQNCNQCLPQNYQQCNFCNTGYSLNSSTYQSCDLIETKNSYKVSIGLTSTGYEVLIDFSYSLINVSINEQILSIKVSIANYSMYSSIVRVSDKQQIIIEISCQDSIKTGTLQIDFQQSKLNSDNKIVDVQNIQDLPPFVIVSAQERQNIASVAAVTKNVSTSIISSIIPVAIVGNFYFLVNMIDLTSFLYFLMALDIRYPLNVTEFYAIFKDFQFPFIPNFFANAINSNYVQYSPKKFMDLGMNSYLISNSGQMMTICFCVIGLYITAKLAHKLIPIKWVNIYLTRVIYETWEYGAFFDMMSSVYIYILIGCLLQTLVFDCSDTNTYLINYILYAISTPICLLTPFILTLFLFKQTNLKSNKHLIVKLSSYVGGLKIENEHENHDDGGGDNNINQEINLLNNSNKGQKQIQNNINNVDNGNAIHDNGIIILSDNQRGRRQVISADVIQELAEEEQLGSPVLVRVAKKRITSRDRKMIQLNKADQENNEASRQEQNNNIENNNQNEKSSQNVNNYKENVGQSNQNRTQDMKENILQKYKESSIQNSFNIDMQKNIKERTRRQQHMAKYSKMCNSFMYIRKILFSLVIVFLYGHCYLQLSLLILMSWIVIFFIIYIQPYDKLSENIKNGCCELALVVIKCCGIFLVDDPPNADENQRLQIGWIIVITSSFMLIWNTLVLTKDTLLSLYEAIQKLILRQEQLNMQQQQKEQKQSTIKPIGQAYKENNYNKSNLSLDEKKFNRHGLASEQSTHNELTLNTHLHININTINNNNNNNTYLFNQPNEATHRRRRQSSIISEVQMLSNSGEIHFMSSQLIPVKKQIRPYSLSQSMIHTKDNQNGQEKNDKADFINSDHLISKNQNDYLIQSLNSEHDHFTQQFSPQLSSSEANSLPESARQILKNSFVHSQFTPRRRRRSSIFKLDEEQQFQSQKTMDTSILDKKISYRKNKKSTFSSQQKDHLNDNHENNLQNQEGNSSE